MQLEIQKVQSKRLSISSSQSSFPPRSLQLGRQPLRSQVKRFLSFLFLQSCLYKEREVWLLSPRFLQVHSGKDPFPKIHMKRSPLSVPVDQIPISRCCTPQRVYLAHGIRACKRPKKVLTLLVSMKEGDRLYQARACS